MADWEDMMDDETGQAFLENEEPPAAAGAAEASGRTSPTAAVDRINRPSHGHCH